MEISKGKIDDALTAGLTVDDFLNASKEGLPEVETREMAEALEQMGQKFIYVSNVDAYYEFATGILRSEKKFFSRVKPIKAKNSDNKRVSIGPLFTASKYRRDVVSLVWRPHEAPGFTHDSCYNIDPGPAYTPKKGDIGYWHRLLDHYFDDSDGGKRLRRIFESWVAYPLKHRGRKLKQAVFFWGGTGTGKTLLSEAVASVYGTQAVEIRQADLNGRFDRHYTWCKTFIYGSEISVDGRKGYDDFKNDITARSRTIEEKGQPIIHLDAHDNRMYSANKPMYLDDDDRRAIVIKVDKRIDLELAKSVSRWLGLQPVEYASEKERAAEAARITDARAALLFYFINEVKIDAEYDPEGRAPLTGAREEVIDAGRSEIDDYVHEKIVAVREDASKDPKSSDLIVLETVFEGRGDMYGSRESSRLGLVDGFAKEGRRPSSTAFKPQLRRDGVERLPRERLASGDRCRPYAVNHIEYWKTAWPSATPETRSRWMNMEDACPKNKF